MNKLCTLRIFFSFIVLLSSGLLQAQENAAHKWNERVLYSISHDFARPTVHARNLFHSSIAMYECWAAYEAGAENYFLGRSLGDYFCQFDGVANPEDKLAAQEEAISYAVYRLINHRFQNSLGYLEFISPSVDSLMAAYGFDTGFTSTDYVKDGPAALGNYVASEIIAFGLQDGSNEAQDYANLFYEPVHGALVVSAPGNPNMVDPNRWQPLELEESFDQAGNPLPTSPPFLSPEWGNLVPYAMKESHSTVKERDGHAWRMYFDPGYPELLTEGEGLGMDSPYKWNFCLVPIWQSHHDPADGVMWDISPKSSGNIPFESMPQNFQEYTEFYNLLDGGDPGTGYDLNPVTGEPYQEQLVPRADYVRVLAEFWADGPNSYTPPGHWFHIYNIIKTHPMYSRQWKGEGEELPELEYDVKAYLLLGGALHDAAIAAWSVKGYYDYLRPISAIRWMADRGQCSDENLPNYHPDGMPLVPGYIELVEEGDELAGEQNEHLHKIKLYTWRGPDYIEDPETDIAGVGWILAENWWPYQQPSFVTPPFAGYVSGHSTYSRTAAEVLTLMTGSPYFPGGMSDFTFEANSFLEFENGPSQTITLQWATYNDASDQTSLSRIWGGIHPPIDDIPGRLMGAQIGPNAFHFTDSIVGTSRAIVEMLSTSQTVINASNIGDELDIYVQFDRDMDTDSDPAIAFPADNPMGGEGLAYSGGEWISPQEYVAHYDVLNTEIELFEISVQVSGASDASGKEQKIFLASNAFVLDTKAPALQQSIPEVVLVNDDQAATGSLFVDFIFNEAMNQSLIPAVSPQHTNNVAPSISFDPGQSEWIESNTLRAVFALNDANQTALGVGFAISNAEDAAGNAAPLLLNTFVIDIDTRNALIVDASLNQEVLNLSMSGNAALSIQLSFDKTMDISSPPELAFENNGPLENSLVLNTAQSQWLSPTQAQIVYDLLPAGEEWFDLQVNPGAILDLSGNMAESQMDLSFTIDTKRPELSDVLPQSAYVNIASAGVGGYYVDVEYSEAMDTLFAPMVSLESAGEIGNTLIPNPILSHWMDESIYRLYFNVNDNDIEVDNVQVNTNFARDAAGNTQEAASQADVFSIDMIEPEVIVVSANQYTVDESLIGEGTLSIFVLFDEAMDESSVLNAGFAGGPLLADLLLLNSQNSGWTNPFAYVLSYDVQAIDLQESGIDLSLSQAQDIAGNPMSPYLMADFIEVDLNLLSTSEEDGALSMGIFPSPLPQGAPLYVRFDRGVQSVRLSMYDMQGRLVWQHGQSSFNKGTHLLQIPQLSAGLYLLQVDDEQQRLGSSKIVVSR